MEDGTVVSSADFVRHFGEWQDRAATDPLFVTHHGRQRHVLLSLTAYKALLKAEPEPMHDTTELCKFETLIVHLDACYIVLDKDLVVNEINPTACLFFDIDRAAIIGRQLDSKIPDLELTAVRAHLNRSLAAGEVATFEMPSVSRPSEWLRCTVYPCDSGVACLIRNITTERAAQAVWESQMSYNDAITAASGVWLSRLSLRGTFSFVSEPLADFIGIKRAVLQKMHFTDILPLRHRADAAQHVDAILGGAPSRRFKSTLLVSRGGEHAVRIGIASHRNDFAVEGASLVIVSEEVSHQL